MSELRAVIPILNTDPSFIGSVYIMGGSDNDGKDVAIVNRLNLSDKRLTTVSPMIMPRSVFAAVASDNSIRIFGGLSRKPFSEVYDLQTDRFVE